MFFVGYCTNSINDTQLQLQATVEHKSIEGLTQAGVYGSEFWTMYNWVQTWGKIKISEVLRATYLA